MTAPDAASGDIAQVEGAMVVLAGLLKYSDHIPAIPAPLVAVLTARIESLPPQGFFRAGEPHFWTWLDVAALAEQLGLAELSESILVQLHHHTIRSKHSYVKEQLALCWSRRARIARGTGSFDLAEMRYAEALRLSRSTRFDARFQSILGLAVMAMIRGNLPLCEKYSRAIVRDRKAPQLYTLSAHQLLSIAYRKRADYLDAMLHAWHAFDLLERDDVRRAELLGTLAEIALDAGELDAALAGFTKAMAATNEERVSTAARVGITNVFLVKESARGNALPLEARLRGEQLLRDNIALFERARAVDESVPVLIASAQLARFIGNEDEATRMIQLARKISLDSRMFELLHQAEATLAQLTAIKQPQNESTGRSARERSAFHRLTTVSV